MQVKMVRTKTADRFRLGLPPARQPSCLFVNESLILIELRVQFRPNQQQHPGESLDESASRTSAEPHTLLFRGQDLISSLSDRGFHSIVPRQRLLNLGHFLFLALD